MPRYIRILVAVLASFGAIATDGPAPNARLPDNAGIPPAVYSEIEELTRLADIAYCVGVTGVYPPFTCASRCEDFPGFELITTWNTGALLSDSCGFIALSHPPFPKRIIVSFRGTYSLSNTIIDLSTVPQEYIPYPDDDDKDKNPPSDPGLLKAQDEHHTLADKCHNCTVHMGFYTSWKLARQLILPHLKKLTSAYPDYNLTLVGHSLGGAVAALAALEFDGQGWHPSITTFGEPRVGNRGLAEYINHRFSSKDPAEARFRRVTHVNDPVPLLPLEEWGFVMHGNEIFISKQDIPPSSADIKFCEGDADPTCISGDADQKLQMIKDQAISIKANAELKPDETVQEQGIPSRFKIWELLFAHRDYFWRIGLCVPGGDPKNWYGKKPSPEGLLAEL